MNRRLSTNNLHFPGNHKAWMQGEILRLSKRSSMHQAYVLASKRFSKVFSIFGCIQRSGDKSQFLTRGQHQSHAKKMLEWKKSHVACNAKPPVPNVQWAGVTAQRGTCWMASRLASKLERRHQSFMENINCNLASKIKATFKVWCELVLCVCIECPPGQWDFWHCCIERSLALNFSNFLTLLPGLRAKHQTQCEELEAVGGKCVCVDAPFFGYRKRLEWDFFFGYRKRVEWHFLFVLIHNTRSHFGKSPLAAQAAFGANGALGLKLQHRMHLTLQ